MIMSPRFRRPWLWLALLLVSGIAVSYPRWWPKVVGLGILTVSTFRLFKPVGPDPANWSWHEREVPQYRRMMQWIAKRSSRAQRTYMTVMMALMYGLFALVLKPLEAGQSSLEKPSVSAPR